ncbi:MAG: IS4/IS5 family transposase [Sphingomonadales bacterium]|nr:MAG: IS4/IS5 family transposase [Sphingomonadales bacterium]
MADIHTRQDDPAKGLTTRDVVVTIGIGHEAHALTDGEGGPLRFLLTGGQVADRRAADVLLDHLPPRTTVLADKAYDSNAIHDLIERQGAVPHIPSKANRGWKNCLSRTRYKGPTAVERMFCRRIPLRCSTPQSFIALKTFDHL